MPEWMSAPHMLAGAHRGQKRSLNPLKVELQVVVSRCWGWEQNLGLLQ